MSRKVVTPDELAAQKRAEKALWFLLDLFLPPYAIMLGVGTLGWHWSYWQSLLIDNAWGIPVGLLAMGLIRRAREEN